MAEMDHANAAKLRVIGGGGRDWRARAQDALGVSERTIRNAISGEISERTQQLIDALYEPLARADAADAEDLVRAGEWSIGRPLVASDEHDVLDECVVSHLVDPALSVLVRLMRGKGSDGSGIVRTAVTPLYGVRDGVGSVIEKARRIALREMTSTSRQEARAAGVSRRVMECRARAKGWSAEDAATMPLEDLVAAADGMTKAQTHDLVAVGQEQLAAADALIAEHGDVPFAAKRDLLEAGRLRERGAWLTHVGKEIAKSRDHVPGQAHAGQRAREWSDDVMHGDQRAVAARQSSPLRKRQVEIAEAVMTEMMDRLRDRLSDDELMLVTDRLEAAEDMIYLQALVGEDAARLEARQQLAQIGRIVNRHKPVDGADGE